VRGALWLLPHAPTSNPVYDSTDTALGFGEERWLGPTSYQIAKRLEAGGMTSEVPAYRFQALVTSLQRAAAITSVINPA